VKQFSQVLDEEEEKKSLDERLHSVVRKKPSRPIRDTHVTTQPPPNQLST
jgi:hypothetical protein